MDDAEQFLPLYLRFLKGVVDSSDLPLNVSRELLQRHPDLDAMKSALTRRALDMLQTLSSDDAGKYGTFWREFGQTIKEGLVEDSANRERLMKLLRFTTTRSGASIQDQSLDEYLTRMVDGQDRIYYLVGDSYETVAGSPHLEQLQAKGIEVILFYDRIDPWLVDHLGEFDGKSFTDVGRGRLALPDADGEMTQDAANEANKGFLKKLRRTLKGRVDTVNVSRRLVDSAACVVTGDDDLSPRLRRMLEATGQDLPETLPVLEINMDHPLVARLAAEADDARFRSLAGIVLDHALLAEGAQLENPADYVSRMNRYLLDLEQQ